MALQASGLEPLFQTLGLDTDAPSLQRAMTWLKHQGADKVADLNQLPPGTYRCSKLADNLGLPMLKAQRLLSAFEGTKSSAIRPEATLHCAALCTLKPRRPARDNVAVLHARHANSERAA